MRIPLFVFFVSFLALLSTVSAQAPSVALDDVVKMLDAQLPEQVILAKIKSAGKPFELSADDLIRLKKAGASSAVMTAMLSPAVSATPAAATSATSAATATVSSPFKEIGVYYKKGGEWADVLPEVVNWKTGGFLKNVASAGVVKKDVNGLINGPNSRNSVASPLEFMIYAPEGVSITEYQLIRFRVNKDYREFRTVTGGVFNTKSGAMRDMVPFEGKKTDSRLYSVVLPANLGAGEYGFIHLGSAGGSGGMTSLSMGKMFTFRLLE